MPALLFRYTRVWSNPWPEKSMIMQTNRIRKPKTNIRRCSRFGQRMACLTIAIRRISDRKTYSGIHRIEFYPVDSVIQPSNNLGLEFIFKRNQWQALLSSIFYISLPASEEKSSWSKLSRISLCSNSPSSKKIWLMYLETNYTHGWTDGFYYTRYWRIEVLPLKKSRNHYLHMKFSTEHIDYVEMY